MARANELVSHLSDIALYNKKEFRMKFTEVRFSNSKGMMRKDGSST